MLIGNEIFIASDKLGGLFAPVSPAEEKRVKPIEFVSDQITYLVPRSVDGLSFFGVDPKKVGDSLVKTIDTLAESWNGNQKNLAHGERDAIYLNLLNRLRLFGIDCLRAKREGKPDSVLADYREYEIKDPLFRIDESELVVYSPVHAVKSVLTGDAARNSLWNQNFKSYLELASLMSIFGLNPDLNFPNDAYSTVSPERVVQRARYFTSSLSNQFGLEIAQISNSTKDVDEKPNLAVASIVYSPFRPEKAVDNKYGW